jgi:hypothetical protein
MRCLKAFGERIAARDPDRQAAEIHIRIALMNRFSALALGTAEIVRVARHQWKGGGQASSVSLAALPVISVLPESRPLTASVPSDPTPELGETALANVAKPD